MLYNLISLVAKFQLSEFVFALYKKLFSLFLFTSKSKFSTFLESNFLSEILYCIHVHCRFNFRGI
jgi:hypothetical protein